MTAGQQTQRHKTSLKAYVTERKNKDGLILLKTYGLLVDVAGDKAYSPSGHVLGLQMRSDVGDGAATSTSRKGAQGELKGVQTRSLKGPGGVSSNSDALHGAESVVQTPSVEGPQPALYKPSPHGVQARQTALDVVVHPTVA
jgi:hypothetical protein